MDNDKLKARIEARKAAGLTAEQANRKQKWDAAAKKAQRKAAVRDCLLAGCFGTVEDINAAHERYKRLSK